MKTDKRHLTIFMPQEERDLITKLQASYHKLGVDISPGYVMRMALSHFARFEGIPNDISERMWKELNPNPLKEIYEKANAQEDYYGK